MNIFTILPPPALPRAEAIAKSLLDRLNRELARRANQHAVDFDAFWNDPVCTPDEILAAMSSDAPLMLATASENLQGFARLAALAGRSLNDVIDPINYMPRRQFLVDEVTSAVTLAPPADGFDAWGRPIPSPPPDPEPAPEPEPEPKPAPEPAPEPNGGEV